MSNEHHFYASANRPFTTGKRPLLNAGTARAVKLPSSITSLDHSLPKILAASTSLLAPKAMRCDGRDPLVEACLAHLHLRPPSAPSAEPCDKRQSLSCVSAPAISLQYLNTSLEQIGT